MSWEATGERTSKVRLDLYLSAHDILSAENAVEALAHAETREQIRQEVFRWASTQIIPDLIADSGHEPKPVDLNVRHKSDAESKSVYTVVSGSVSVFHETSVEIDLTTDRDADPLTVIYAARGGIASQIADAFTHDLEAAYLGKFNFHTKNQWVLPQDDAPTLKTESAH